ncbi:hypothetical protein D3C76_790680 [compost metagenome]
MAYQVIALDLLLPHVEQRHPGGRYPLDLLGHDGAHHRKLQQGVGIAAHVCPQIQHHCALSAQCRQRLDEGGPVDPGQGFEHAFGHGHQGTGIAGTDAGIGLTGFHQIEHNPHGGVFQGTQRHDRFFAHADDLGCMYETNAGMSQQAMLLQQRGDQVLVTDQNKI